MNETATQKSELQEKLHFEISEENGVDLNSDRYTKLECASEQAICINALMQQLPSFAAAGTIANSYRLVFPEGIEGTLMRYKTESAGLGTPIIGENGKIVGHAELFDMRAEAAILGAFTAISVVTGQYFLSEINSKLTLLNLKVDKIMEFLYGDKKAELMAEISFVQQSQQNYSSIMSRDTQRTATITGLQQACKTAMKDIEFYMYDLYKKARADEKLFGKFRELSDSALSIRDSLELAKQLFVMGHIMEAYFARNFDPSYIKSVSETVAYYINKCDKNILGSFNILRSKADKFKDSENTKILKEKFDAIIGSLDGGDEAPILRSMSEALSAATARREYFVDRKGGVYLRA